MTGLLHEKEFSRKSFIKGGGALVVGFSLAGAVAGKASAGLYNTEGTYGSGATGNTPFNQRTGADYLPNLNTVDAWLAITSENKLIVTTGETEMGHGTPTGILMLMAEELNMPAKFGLTSDASAQVQWAHPETWLNATGGGGGSGGISSRATQARAAAAYAMQQLFAMASTKLNVPVASLTASNGSITGGGQTVTYASLIGGQNFNYDMPLVGTAGGSTSATATQFTPGTGITKPVSQYSIVGTAVQRIDIPNKVNGSYTYIQNVFLPGMLHARSVRPRGAGADTFENDTPLSIDASSIANIPGAKVVQVKNFVSVTAPLEYNAIQAAAQLKVTWETQQGFPQPSSNYWEWLRQAGNTNTLNPARYVTDTGGVPAALASAAHTVSATYKYHYNNFVPIGPHAAVADVNGTTSATVFGMGESISAGTTSSGLAYVLGIPPNMVRYVWYEGASMFGGGQFAEAAEQAAVISQAIGKPVRMQWMRWDQTGWDSYGPSQMYDVTMGANAAGNITVADWVAYGQAGSSIDETQRLLGLASWAAVPGSGGPTPSDTGVYGVTGTYPTGYGPSYQYQRRVLAKSQPLYGGSLKSSALRAPNAPQSYFASEQIVDELAHSMGMDPIAFRRMNIDGTTVLGARWLACMDAATESAGWQPRVAGSVSQSGNIRTGRGFAFGTFASSQVAVVADAEVNLTTGKMVAKHVTVAQNNGITMSPSLVTNQMSGALIQGLSRAMWEQPTWNTERITSLDWVSYPILRFVDAPTLTLINVHPGQYVTVIPGDMSANVQAGNTAAFNEGWLTSGSGEPPTSAIAAGMANAFFDATGVRIRQSPMRPETTRGVLRNAGIS
jgi:CO/xanthine dehydrogenase Mo-binding subunit